MNRRRKQQTPKTMNSIYCSILIVLVCVICFFMGRKSVKRESSEKQNESYVAQVSSESENNYQEEERVTAVPMDILDDESEIMTESVEMGSDVEQRLFNISDLIVSNRPSMYSYNDMLTDMKVLEANYPDVLTIESIAKTVDGRDVWLYRIGSENAAHKVLFNAGTHAREYITSQLLMELMCNFIDKYMNNGTYGNCTIRNLMQDTAIYVIPMVNPDGISISQLGMDGVLTDQVRKKIKTIAKKDGETLNTSYLTRWKANANGVDLNRNFDARWDEYIGSGHISSDHYKGEFIGSESESEALIRITEREMFERTISYHTQGEVIYWYFDQKEPLYSATYSFAERIGSVTGYKLDANYKKLDPAGYKDWCVYKMDIPSITIEVGKKTSPVPSGQYDSIYKQNENIFEETLIDLTENSYYPRGEKADDSQPSIPYDTKNADLTVVNCKEYISLREEPSTSAAVIDKIPLGSHVRFIAKAVNDFYQIEYGGHIGFAKSEYLE